MTKTFQFKNWEIFLTLFLIPYVFIFNFQFLFDWFYIMIPTTIFFLIWVFILSLWFYKIADKFRTEYLKKIEFELYYSNLIVINIVFIILAPIFLLSFYTEHPIVENIFDVLSKIKTIINIYVYTALFSTLIIAARIISAKKKQNKIRFSDFYKNTIAFLVLPVGIFWIQKEINKITIDKKNSNNKNRSIVLLGITLFLSIVTAYNFKNKELTIEFGNKNNSNFINDSSLIEIAHQQYDSLFNNMTDSSKANYMFNAALQLYQMGDYRNTINNLNISITLDSLKSEYYYNRGVVLYEEFNQLDSAIADMTTTIELDSNDWKAYQNRGFYNYLLENYKIALPDIDKVIELKSDFSSAFLLRGELKKQLNDITGACKDWRIADSLGNGDALLKIMENCN